MLPKYLIGEVIPTITIGLVVVRRIFAEITDMNVSNYVYEVVEVDGTTTYLKTEAELSQR